MTQDFKNMLLLFAQNATGTTVEITGGLNIEKIRELSLEQGIWTIVFPELAKICDVKKYQAEFFQTISKAIAQKEFNLNILQKIEENGIKCCILKGAAIAHTYSDPECRVSGDMDILIDEKDEEKVLNILEKNGYVVEKRGKNGHHSVAHHKAGGLLEVHIMLYSYTAEQILFDGLDMYGEAWRKIKIGEKEFYTLGVNDTVMYLTAHYIKHFVNEGGGVRQMMDLLLFMKAYKTEIDFEKYNNILKELRYDKLIEAVKTVGRKYFGLDFEANCEEMAEIILSDSEAGGIFGFKTDERSRFYNAYCEKRTLMPKHKYKVFMLLKDYRGVRDRIFPKQNRMVIVYKYSYAKNKLLLPVAWAHRIFDILRGKRRNKITEDKTGTEAFQNRMKMMRDLGMIN